MQTILRFSGILFLIAAAGGVVFWLMGEADLLPLVPGLFVVGIVLLSLSVILDRLRYVEFLLKSSSAAQTNRIKTELGDFEMLANVEGEATCLRCRKTAPRAGLYYSRSLDVYYHPECLARDRGK